ncbi:MAG: cytochrome c [Verrucomicrobiota bacterium JB022]|nr:cytochrome c [Verrucomicrobiota bacterium JB022]
MKQFLVIYVFGLIAFISLMGFRGCKFRQAPLEIFPDMDRQAKFLEQAGNGYFADGRNDRPAVPGTMPHLTAFQENYVHTQPDGHFREDDYLATGAGNLGTNNAFGDGIPVDLTQENMDRGQELFNIYCIACHGEVGNGKGVVAAERYGFATIVSLLDTRIMEQPDGEIFNTITHGKNTMYAYGSKIRVEDRWKVVMYVRALQRASASTIDDVPPEHREDL